MPIATKVADIPSGLKKPYTRRSMEGQIRQGIEVAHLVGEVVTISAIIDGSLIRTSGRLARVYDSAEYGEDEDGAEGWIVSRTVMWFEQTSNPFILDWSDVRECVAQLGGAEPFKF